MISKSCFFGMFRGQKVIFPDVDSPDTLTGIVEQSIYVSGGCDYALIDCKLILRPLSAMTEEERIIHDKFYQIKAVRNNILDFVPPIEYLISIGINIFEGIVPADWYTYEEVKNG